MVSPLKLSLQRWAQLMMGAFTAAMCNLPVPQAP